MRKQLVNVRLFSLCVVAAIGLAGCAALTPVKWKSTPAAAVAETDAFRATLTPACSEYMGCESFILSIENRSSDNIEVNWNKTLFVLNGQTSGGFMFEGVVYKDRNAPKPPDIVFAGSTMTKSIWPNNLTYFSSGHYGGWGHETIPQGKTGAYLTLMIDGKERSEQLLVTLVAEKITRTSKKKQSDAPESQ